MDKKKFPCGPPECTYKPKECRHGCRTDSSQKFKCVGEDKIEKKPECSWHSKECEHGCVSDTHQLRHCLPGAIICRPKKKKKSATNLDEPEDVFDCEKCKKALETGPGKKKICKKPETDYCQGKSKYTPVKCEDDQESEDCPRPETEYCKKKSFFFW